MFFGAITSGSACELAAGEKTQNTSKPLSFIVTFLAMASNPKAMATNLIASIATIVACIIDVVSKLKPLG